MTVPTVEAAVGGQFSGSGASPGGAGSGTGLNAIAGDIILVLCYTSRSLTSGNFDFHEVASITSAGLTFNKIIDESYQYEEVSGSFPAASCHVDAFIAVVGGTITNQTWSSTMAGGDTFVNDGWAVAITIRGADTSTILDTYSGNPVTETNVSLSASAASVTTDIIASESILFFLAFMHTVGAQATLTVPAGFTVPGTGDGTHFKTTTGGGSATATKVDGVACYKTYTGPQSALNVATGSTDNCWFGATIAIRSADAVVPNTMRSVGVMIQ